MSRRKKLGAPAKQPLGPRQGLIKRLTFLRILILLFVLLASVIPANAQLREDFEDGNFDRDPTWLGDVTKFMVVNGQLQSQSEQVNDRFYLSTALPATAPMLWEFRISLSFNTSSLNYVDVFLTSDSARLTGLNSGVFVRVGGTEDAVSLYKKEGANSQPLKKGRSGRTSHAGNMLKIRVSRSADGFYRIWSDSTGSGDHWLPEGSVQDTGSLLPAYFGFSIRQSTASFFKRHFLDDIYAGPIPGDTTGPRVKEFEKISQDTIRILFSEKLSGTSLQSANYQIDGGIGSPLFTSFYTDDSSRVELVLAKPLEAKRNYRLQITGCADLQSNPMADTFLDFQWFPTFPPQKGALLITEFLPDPEPSLSLPAEEFIELFNRSGADLQLEGCRLGDRTSTGIFPKTTLGPGEYLIVCAPGNESLLAPFGMSLGLEGFPSLNNGGDELLLRNAKGELLQRVVYEESEMDDALKKEGGWSLEIRDEENLCRANNFIYSNDKSGGTPGRISSVKSDLHVEVPPRLKSISFPSADQLRLRWSEPPDSLTAVDLSLYHIDPNKISEIVYDFETLTLRFELPFTSGTNYRLTLNALSNCSGNMTIDTAVLFGLPEKVEPGDLILNEVLFNPPPGGSDFVEIYNRSQKILSLRDLVLFNRDINGDPADLQVADTNGTLIFPATFCVFTSDLRWTAKQYPRSNSNAFVRVSALPLMKDEEGYIGLMDRSGTEIDGLHYSESMHFPLLSNTEGVSLERIVYEAASSDPGNFTSAAATYQFGTPGIANSHRGNEADKTEWLSLEPDLISPDNDGLEDFAAISIHTTDPEAQATVMIFDRDGAWINTIANNVPVGNDQTWFWNGMNAQNRPAGMGIYVVYAELHGPHISQRVKKKTVTVGAR